MPVHTGSRSQRAAGAALGSAATTGAIFSGGASLAGTAGAALATGSRGALLAGHGMVGAGTSMRGAMSILNRGGARAAAGYIGAGARAQMAQSTVANRLGSFAGSSANMALRQGQRSIRTFADTSRLLAQDTSGYGVRR